MLSVSYLFSRNVFLVWPRTKKPEYAGYCRKMRDSVVKDNGLFPTPAESFYVQSGEVKNPVSYRGGNLLH